MSPRLPLRCLEEVVGTALLVGIGVGSIVEGARLGGVPQLDLAIAWFVAVALPVLLFAAGSGAHLNPIVTLTLVGSRRFPAREALPYVGSQIVGAFVGAGVVLLTMGGEAHLGATLPAGGDLPRTFVLELGFTFALLLSVLYLTMPLRTPRAWELLLPATVVGFSTFFIGPYTGSSLNPARTIAPAVLSGDYQGIGVYLAAAAVAGAIATGAALLSQRRAEERGAEATESSHEATGDLA